MANAEAQPSEEADALEGAYMAQLVPGNPHPGLGSHIAEQYRSETRYGLVTDGHYKGSPSKSEMGEVIAPVPIGSEWTHRMTDPKPDAGSP